MNFAVQAHKETSSAVAQMIIQEAIALGVSFKHLEFLDSIQVGSTTFHRYQIKPNPTEVLNSILSKGRGVIRPSGDGFEVCLVGGRKGSIPLTTMLSAARTPKMYRGPGDPHWKRQFEQEA